MLLKNIIIVIDLGFHRDTIRIYICMDVCHYKVVIMLQLSRRFELASPFNAISMAARAPDTW